MVNFKIALVATLQSVCSHVGYIISCMIHHMSYDNDNDNDNDNILFDHNIQMYTTNLQ